MLECVELKERGHHDDACQFYNAPPTQRFAAPTRRAWNTLTLVSTGVCPVSIAYMLLADLAETLEYYESAAEDLLEPCLFISVELSGYSRFAATVCREGRTGGRGIPTSGTRNDARYLMCLVFILP